MNRRRGSRLFRLSMRLFSALLWLYPPSLRAEYGDEMRLLFRDTLREQIARVGPPGALVALLGALGDLAATLPREWPREVGQMRRRGRRRVYRRLLSRAAFAAASSSVLYGPGRRRFSEPRRDMQQNFGKFTERARKVMSLAQEEAQRFNHSHIGTEHILLGLLREEEGVAAAVLRNLGVELFQARNAVEFIIGRGDRLVPGEVGLTPRSKKVIELAVDEARRLNHQYIGTEHLLLGIVREGEGIASGVLESLGVNLEKVRAETINVLSSSGHFSQTVGSSVSPSAGGSWPQVDRGRLSPSARKVIGDAFLAAQTRGHEDITTGHVLLALLNEQNGVAESTLALAGMSLAAVRAELERILGAPLPSDQQTHGPVRMDEHTRRVIVLAVHEARSQGDLSVHPEHLLLGIVRERAGSGGQVLLKLSGKVKQLRQASMRARASEPAARERRPMVAQVTLLCRDVAATQTFYAGRFGGQVIPGTPGDDVIVSLPGGGPELALRGGATDAIAGAVELTVRVGDVDLLWRTCKDDSVADLSDLTVDERGRFFTVRDPDGRLLRVTMGR